MMKNLILKLTMCLENEKMNACEKAGNTRSMERSVRIVILLLNCTPLKKVAYSMLPTHLYTVTSSRQMIRS